MTWAAFAFGVAALISVTFVARWKLRRRIRVTIVIETGREDA